MRFANHAPITVIVDAPVPEPAPYKRGVLSARVESFTRTRLLHDMTLPGPMPALDVNALDEVPDSSWFRNRIGAQGVTPEQIRRGPGGGPDLTKPLQILSSKSTGTAPGLNVRDARGDEYLLKFDPGAPEAETGADILVQRLLWAAGYNVPENHVVHLARRDFVLAPGAIHKQLGRPDRPLTVRDLDALLALVPRTGNGRYRCLVSKRISGKPVGGFPMAGVRGDDANDRIPHEHRRELRALRVFFAWLGQSDVKEDNTLDVWIEDRATARGRVIHYLLDFGKALGVWGLARERELDGYAPHFDYTLAARSLFSFGLWRRPWEGVRGPPLRGVGRYEAEHFDPGMYSPANPYAPFLYTDRNDAFWAARIIARFGRQHIAAAVAAAQYSDPRARNYLITTILARQRKTLRHWFARVSPLDRLAVDVDAHGFQICAIDLSVAYRLDDPGQRRYGLSVHDKEGGVLARPRGLHAAPDGRVCSGRLPSARTRDGYTMVAYTVWRGDTALPPMIVHLARDPASARLRVIGIERQ